MTMYKSSATNLQHLSVGAILLTDQGDYVLHQKQDVFSFATGTLEGGESPVGCLQRELMEEMGATCRVEGYAGSSAITITDHRGTWIKTTLWHHCTLTSRDERARTDLHDGAVVVVSASALASLPKDQTRWPW